MLGGVRVTSRPLKLIEPAVGSMNPAIMRSSVVLPHPEGPSRKNSSPGSMVSETSSTARVTPARPMAGYSLVRAWIWIWVDTGEGRGEAIAQPRIPRERLTANACRCGTMGVVSDRDLQRAAAAIERLRGFRVRPGPDRRASGAIDALRDDLGKRVRQTGGMVEAWRAVAPDELRERTAVGGFRRGVLTIEASDGSTRYLVQRWLRAGGERMLAGCAPATVRKVRVVVGGGGV